MEMRKTYSNTLDDILKENKNAIVLEADQASSSGTSVLFEKYPHQTINCGIAEANMVGVAAGLSLCGYKPFLHSFSPFVTRRVLDQIYSSLAYSKNSVHIYGSDPGYWALHNGGTHTTYEDMAIMSSIPNVVVTAPSDSNSFRWIMNEYLKQDRVFYTRSTRKELSNIYDDNYQFGFGKANVIKKGEKIALLAIGEMVHEALVAHDKLLEENIKCEVIDMLFLKPIDEKKIIEVMRDFDCIMTIENHSKFGGLASNVSMILQKNGYRGYFDYVAVNDEFGEVGNMDFFKK